MIPQAELLKALLQDVDGIKEVQSDTSRSKLRAAHAKLFMLDRSTREHTATVLVSLQATEHKSDAPWNAVLAEPEQKRSIFVKVLGPHEVAAWKS